MPITTTAVMARCFSQLNAHIHETPMLIDRAQAAIDAACDQGRNVACICTTAFSGPAITQASLEVREAGFTVTNRHGEMTIRW